MQQEHILFSIKYFKKISLSILSENFRSPITHKAITRSYFVEKMMNYIP